MNEWEWHLLEDKPPVDQLLVNGVKLKVGDRVRLRPCPGGDILDMALADKIAVIEAIVAELRRAVSSGGGAGR